MEGITSLEEYIFSLKFTVGLGILEEVVGIGKEKEDLTRFGVKPRKKNNQWAFSAPTCKDLSSLGPSDIIQSLTGSRLSKTKSNGLFWEAFWPRLITSKRLTSNEDDLSHHPRQCYLKPKMLICSEKKITKTDGRMTNKKEARDNPDNDGNKMVESRKYQHAFDVDSLEQHADMNLRRRITRNKPLKVRALQSECITKKFLHPEKRQKSEDIQTAQDPFNPCRKPRTRGKTMMRRIC